LIKYLKFIRKTKFKFEEEKKYLKKETIEMQNSIGIKKSHEDINKLYI